MRRLCQLVPPTETFLARRPRCEVCHRNISEKKWIIVDTFFSREKISASFRDILTTPFKYSNHRRRRGEYSTVRFFSL
jgi:hypothetical protein